MSPKPSRRQWRHDLKVGIVSASIATVIAAPSAAVAAYVANADKVDNKHAVGAGASTSARAGKLVATNAEGRLPNDIITKAPDSARLGGLSLRRVQTQWLTVGVGGAVLGSSPGASGLTVTHPATGTYCVSDEGVDRTSMAGNVQSQVNGFEDLTLVVTSMYNTSACDGTIRIYTAKAGVLYDTPFTLTFARAG